MYCSEQFLFCLCLHDAILPNCPKIFAQVNANVSCVVLYLHSENKIVLTRTNLLHIITYISPLKEIIDFRR